MLRDRLLGAWTLASFHGTTRSGRIFYPMGPAARGRLLYTADGQVGVNLMTADRRRGSPSTRFDVLGDLDAAELARGYMAYGGPFEVDEARAVVLHHFEVCLDPELIGTVQERHVRFVGDDLELGAAAVRPGEPGPPMFLRWARVARPTD